MKGTEDSEIAEPWLTGPVPLPQVPPWACVSAIPRSVALDAVSQGPVATPARAIPVSGSVRRAHIASVGQTDGVEGGDRVGWGSAGSPPDQSPLRPQMWTNVAACPCPVLPGAAKTLQGASVACAAPVSEPARGLRSVWVRNPPHLAPSLTLPASAVALEQLQFSNASRSPFGPSIATQAPGPTTAFYPSQPALPVQASPCPANAGPLSRTSARLRPP